MKLVISIFKNKKCLKEVPILSALTGVEVFPGESTVTLQELKEAIEIDGGEKFLDYFKNVIMTRFPSER